MTCPVLLVIFAVALFAMTLRLDGRREKTQRKGWRGRRNRN